MTVVSIMIREAVEKAKKISNIIFKWIKPNKDYKNDDFSFFILKTFLNTKRLSFKNLWSLLYYIFKSAGFFEIKRIR